MNNHLFLKEFIIHSPRGEHNLDDDKTYHYLQYRLIDGIVIRNWLKDDKTVGFTDCYTSKENFNLKWSLPIGAKDHDRTIIEKTIYKLEKGVYSQEKL